MAADPALIEWIEEALAPLGVVTWRRMMGGATLYLDGTVFAIISRDELWFKADTESDALWDDAGCERFTAEMRGKIVSMNYRRAPADVYDDPDAMREWAAPAIAAGQRAPKRKPRKR